MTSSTYRHYFIHEFEEKNRFIAHSKRINAKKLHIVTRSRAQHVPRLANGSRMPENVTVTVETVE